MHFTPRVSAVLMENPHVLNVVIRLLKMVKQHMEINVIGVVFKFLYKVLNWVTFYFLILALEKLR